MSEPSKLRKCPNPKCSDSVLGLHRPLIHSQPHKMHVACGCGVFGPIGRTGTEAISLWNALPRGENLAYLVAWKFELKELRRWLAFRKPTCFEPSKMPETNNNVIQDLYEWGCEVATAIKENPAVVSALAAGLGGDDNE